MTNNVNGIGLNTGGVNGYPAHTRKDGAKPEENTPEVPAGQAQNTPLNPDDVLTFLAQTAVYNKPVNLVAGKYDVSKYVTPEQAARIAGFMTSFENEVAQGLVRINEEFGDNLSDAAKLDLAARMVE